MRNDDKYYNSAHSDSLIVTLGRLAGVGIVFAALIGLLAIALS